MASFGEVYAAEYRRLVGELFAITGSLGDAEDHVQDAFAKAFGRWEQVGELDLPVAWIRRVALNAAVSRWRSRRRHLTTRPVPDVGGYAPPPEPVLDLLSALTRLPMAQREAIVLHHLTGLSVVEIAELTGCPEATVKARLQRGRARLGALLTENPEEATRP